MQLYIPKTGNTVALCIKQNYFSIAFFFPVFRYSTAGGLQIRRPHFLIPKMTALERFFDLVKLDQMPRVVCQKCIKYPIEFHTSIREGNELQYSGYYTRTILDIILRRNK